MSAGRRLSNPGEDAGHDGRVERHPPAGGRADDAADGLAQAAGGGIAGRSLRYRDIASDLQGKIADGTYAVGQNLPTEAMLRRSFGVSRHTVREALKRLASRGLVERRRAIGTLVRARYPEGRYRQPLPTAAALLELPAELQAEVVERETVVADHGLARLLGCSESRAWRWLGVIRRTPEGPPVVWSELFVCPSIAQTADLDRLSGMPAVLEGTLMEKADSIDVVVDARRLSARQAEHLAVDPDSAALSVVRRLHNGTGLYCVSVSLYPQGRFGFEARMSRCWRPGEPAPG